MTDSNFRNIIQSLKKDPDNLELLRQLAIIRSRTGLKDMTFYKIKNSDNKFLFKISGYDYKTYKWTPKLNFTKTGTKFKSLKSVNEYLKLLLDNNEAPNIKNCSIVEIREVEINDIPVSASEILESQLLEKKKNLEKQLKKLETTKLAEIKAINEKIEKEKAQKLKEAQEIEKELAKTSENSA